MQHGNTRRGQTQGSKNAVNKNKCHSRGILSGISHIRICRKEVQVLLNKQLEQKGDPRLYPAQKPCGTGSSGMTLLYDNPLTPRFARPSPSRAGETACGFTLIELLVVVLIIGLLAAVALPQYNKAVKKAQGTELLTAIDAMDKALASFYQTYGKYEDPTSTGIIHREFLDVELPDLKYWEYANNGYGNDSDAPAGSSLIQIGSNGLGIFHSNSRGTRVNVRWENGHLLYGLCYGDECGEYFNCNWTERISYPCPGPQWCSAEIVRECYLNL